MATINLSSYKGANDNTSILGYSPTSATNITAWANDAAAGTGGSTPVASIKWSDSAATEVSLGGGWKETANSFTVGSSNKQVSVLGGAEVNNITTGSGADSIISSASDVKVTAGAGNDLVSLSSADGANINVGDGNDSVSIVSTVSNTTIALMGGEDVVSIGGNVDALTLTQSGSAGDKLEFAGNVSSAKLTLGTGKDSVSVTSNIESSTLTMGGGEDIVSIGGKSEGNKITFGKNDDSLVIGTKSSSDTIVMGAGDDKVSIAAVEGGTIDLGAGADVVSLGSVADAVINAGAGADTISVSGAVSGTKLILDADDDVVSIAGAVKDSTIDGGAGKDLVSLGAAVTGTTFTMGAGNDSVVLAGSSVELKDNVIDLGAGADLVSIGGGNVDGTKITLGAGKDTVSVGAFTGGTATITDFNVLEDVIVDSGLYQSVSGGANAVLKSDGTMSVGSGFLALDSKAGYYAAKVSNGSTAATVLWTGDSAVEINASSFKDPMVIFGTTNDAADTLRGGKGADSIYAGAGDVVYGGGGADSITFASGDDKRETVALVNGAGTAASVAGFSAGFGDSNDAIYLAENSISALASKSAFVEGTDMQVKLGTSTLTLAGVELSSTTQTEKLKVIDNTNTAYDVMVLANNANLAASETTDVAAMADYYVATGSTATLSFAGISDTLAIELGNTGVYGGTSTFVGDITAVTGGTGNTVLIGSGSKKETLTAGGGQTSLWGGGSAADTLVGASSEDSKTTFFYRTGDGKDEVQLNNVVDNVSKDVLDLTGVSFTSIKKDASGLVMNTANAADKLTVTGVTDENTIVNFTLDGKNVLKGKYGLTDGTATNNFTYATDVAVYYGGKSDTLTVGSDITSANIQLDGSQGVGYAGITNIDASSNNGSLIIGGLGTANETITAGTGSASIWGGAGSSKDTLNGSTTGSTTFFWGTDNGNDTINSTGSGDKVFFYNVSSTAGTVTDIKDTVDTDGNMVFTLATGEKLTLTGLNSGAAVSQFTFADGVTYNYNYSAEAGKRWSIAGQQA